MKKILLVILSTVLLSACEMDSGVAQVSKDSVDVLAVERMDSGVTQVSKDSVDIPTVERMNSAGVSQDSKTSEDIATAERMFFEDINQRNLDSGSMQITETGYFRWCVEVKLSKSHLKNWPGARHPNPEVERSLNALKKYEVIMEGTAILKRCLWDFEGVYSGEGRFLPHPTPWANPKLLLRVFVGAPGVSYISLGGMTFIPEAHDDFDWTSSRPPTIGGYVASTARELGPCP